MLLATSTNIFLNYFKHRGRFFGCINCRSSVIGIKNVNHRLWLPEIGRTAKCSDRWDVILWRKKKQKEKYFQFTSWLVANWLTFQNPAFTHLTFFTLNERDWKHWRKCIFGHRKKHHLNLFWMEMKSAFWSYLWVQEPQSPFVYSRIMYTGAEPASQGRSDGLHTNTLLRTPSVWAQGFFQFTLWTAFQLPASCRCTL